MDIGKPMRILNFHFGSLNSTMDLAFPVWVLGLQYGYRDSSESYKSILDLEIPV